MLGIKSIFKSNKILMIVIVDAKATILKDIITGPITPQVPASVLQLHNDVTIVADQAALALLPKASA